MAKTRINPKALDWDEIPTGTIAAGANLGLNSSNILVKASVSGGGGISFDGSTANGVLTYKDSDEATVEPYLTFDGSSLKLMSSADTGDYFTLTVGAAGTMVAATNDDDGTAANLTFDVDGTIYLDSYDFGYVILREGAQEYLRFERRATVGQDDAIIKNMEDGVDIIFQQYDGTETLRLTDAGDVKVTADIYVDKIRRASDSSTTTKILLNDEAIKLYAGHSSDNICTIDSTGLKIDNGSLETATIDYTDGDNAMTIADGGKVTFAAGFDVGSDAAGDILYHNGTSYVRLAKGTADQVLTMNDAATAPNWEDASGGGSSSKGFTIHLASRLKVGGTVTSLYTRTSNFGASLGGDWSQQRYTSATGYSEDDTSFTDDLEHAWNYYGVAMAPFDCTLDEVIVGMFSKSTVNDAPKYDVWKASPTEAADNDSNLTWTRLTGGGGTNFYANAADNDESHYVDKQSLSSSNSVSEGDMISFTWRSGGSSMSSTYNMFTTTLVFTEA